MPKMRQAEFEKGAAAEPQFEKRLHLLCVRQDLHHDSKYFGREGGCRRCGCQRLVCRPKTRSAKSSLHRNHPITPRKSPIVYHVSTSVQLDALGPWLLSQSLTKSDVFPLSSPTLSSDAPISLILVLSSMPHKTPSRTPQLLASTNLVPRSVDPVPVREPTPQKQSPRLVFSRLYKLLGLEVSGHWTGLLRNQSSLEST